jgi:hypothetical protein
MRLLPQRLFILCLFTVSVMFFFGGPVNAQSSDTTKTKLGQNLHDRIEKRKKIRRVFSLFGVEQHESLEKVKSRFNCILLESNDRLSKIYSHKCSNTEYEFQIRTKKSLDADRKVIQVVVAYVRRQSFWPRV